MDVEDEIDVLESKKENLEFLIMELEENEEDKKEEIEELKYEIEQIDEELDVLYSYRDNEWRKEKDYEVREYWSMAF